MYRFRARQGVRQVGQDRTHPQDVLCVRGNEPQNVYQIIRTLSWIKCPLEPRRGNLWSGERWEIKANIKGAYHPGGIGRILRLLVTCVSGRSKFFALELNRQLAMNVITSSGRFVAFDYTSGGMGWGGRSHTQLFITKPLNGLFNQNYFSIHQHSLRWLWLALLDLWQSSVILLPICYGQKQESSPVVLWLYCCKFSLFHLLHCFFL